MGLPAYVINLLTSDATVTVSSEDTAYPKENLFDFQLPNVFRATSKTTLTILIDFKAAVQVDSIALLNHNLSVSSTVTIKAGNVTPPVTTVGSFTYRAGDMWESITQTTARYWLITIADANPNYLEMGQLVLGRRVLFPRQRRLGQKFLRNRNTIGGETYAGAVFRYYLFKRYEFNMTFRLVGETEKQILDTLDEVVYGDAYPFTFIPDETLVNVYYVRKEATFSPNELDDRNGENLIYDYQLSLTEEPKGLDIQE